jgi:hypothetical protein
MVLAMAVLLFQFPAFSGASHAPQPAFKASAVAGAAKTVPEATRALPGFVASPAATDVAADAADASKTVTAVAEQPLRPRSNASLAESAMSDVYLPPAPPFRPAVEPVRQSSRVWFVLSAAQHGSAAFDAWSTRSAISQGRAEADPMMRPFANSAAIYGAIQVVPIGLDYVARRMQRSTGWTHHVWWLPQSLATATFLFSGSYNVAHTP